MAEETSRFWHMGFHSAPDIPEALIAGRELPYLSWFVREHAADLSAIDDEDLARHARDLARPGGLRVGFAHDRSMPESTRQIRELARRELSIPVLAFGGDACLGVLPTRLMREVADRVGGEPLPGAGLWLAEERPEESASRLLDFFGRPCPPRQRR